MAVGGPWDSADGGDPSIDDSVLIQTALRFVLATLYWIGILEHPFLLLYWSDFHSVDMQRM